ncbi:hypothetical protein AB9Q10_15045 [Streptomyces krungchingensis]|uniref:hypothetical protein n=1 Tax=Streptomyces krungchingensis TaxID=1565034 RepID=UPI003CE87811
MNRLALSRAGVAAVASALTLTLATGCSDSGSDDGGRTTGADKETTAAKALSGAELKQRIIVTSDVDGYKVESTDKSGGFTTTKDDLEVEDAKCAPIAYVMAGLAPGDSAADVKRVVTQDPSASPGASPSKKLEDMTDEELDDAMKSITDALTGTVTIVSLSSYEGDGAEKTLSSVSDAVKGCAGGFKVADKGDAQKITKVESEKASGKGDEALAFAVTVDADGGDVTVHGEVVRHGGTIATYYTLSLAAFSGETADGAADYDIPSEIIKAQTAKLA